MARLDCSAVAVARSPLHSALFLGGGERAVLASSSTALLCLISLCSCFSMGAFSPLQPEIGRAGAGRLAARRRGRGPGLRPHGQRDPRQLAGGRYLGTTLCASPALMLAGTVLLPAS